MISIIIPVYNAEKYLDRCIKSVIEQIYTNIEVITINDGSSDGSGEICDSYAIRDNRIRVVQQMNKGVSYARNIGIHISRGDYIVFVDSDDWVMSTYVWELYNGVIESSVDMAIVDYYTEINNQLDYNTKDDRIRNIFNCSEALDLIYDKDKYLGYLWNKIFSAKRIREINLLFDERIKIWEDLLFCCQYINKIKKIVYIRKPLYVYMHHEDSTVSSRSPIREKTKLFAAEKLLLINNNDAQKFTKRTKAKYATTCINYLILGEFMNNEFIKKSISEKLDMVKPYIDYLDNKNKLKYIGLKICPRLVYVLVQLKHRVHK